MIYGLVDMGANSIRLSIYEAENGGAKLLMNKKDTAGLSSYVKDGALTGGGIRKACRVLGDFQEILDNFGIRSLNVFATASLRNIANTKDAVDGIRAKTGIEVDVLSGAEEAMLDFIGISCAGSIEDGMLIDIGGGSTEIAEFSGGKVLTASSMPIGSLNLFLHNVKDVLPTEKMCREIRTEVLGELDKLTFSGKKRYPTVYGVGGTIRATAKLANAMYDLPDENQKIRYETLNDILQTYQDSREHVRKGILQTSPERVHTLVPGMILLRTVVKKFHGNLILANNCGVREGYLYAKVLHRPGAVNE